MVSNLRVVEPQSAGASPLLWTLLYTQHLSKHSCFPLPISGPSP